MQAQVHKALSNPKRIEIVSKLYQAEGNSIELDTVTIPMYHQHLPMLDEHDFIKWDVENKHIVKTGTRFDELKPLLEIKH